MPGEEIPLRSHETPCDFKTTRLVFWWAWMASQWHARRAIGTLMAMKVALLSEADWLEREASTLRRMIVGLAGESVRLVPVMPTTEISPYLPMVSERVGYPTSRLAWWRRWQLRRAGERLAELEVDALHGLEADSAESVLRLGAQLNLPTICSCWTADGIERLARTRGLAAGQPVVYTLPTEALMERAATALGSGASLERVRPGVLIEEETIPPPLEDPDQSLSVLILCDGRVDDAISAMLRALSMAKSNLPQLQMFFYMLGNGSRKLWQAVARMGLLGQVTLLKPGPGVRNLVIQADAVFQPQAISAVRCVLLEAMAARRPVFAAADPVLDYLIDQRTATLLPPGKPDVWAEALNRLVSEPQAQRSLGESAHRYIVEHYSASAFNRRLIEIYARLTAEALPFDSQK